MNTDSIDWFKSSYSGSEADCVETSTSLLDTGKVPVRDSKDVSLPHLTFSAGAFAAFVSDVKDGTYGL